MDTKQVKSVKWVKFKLFFFSNSNISRIYNTINYLSDVKQINTMTLQKEVVKIFPPRHSH